MKLLRWSWRDLRSRWVQVVAIAVIIGLGVGAYAGLMSTAEWRRASADHNYALLNMYDVSIELPEEAAVEAGTLAGLAVTADPAAVTAAEERLIVPTQVAVDAPEGRALLRGVVVGLPIADGGPEVNRIHAHEGRTLEPADAGEPVAMVEHNFAVYYDLPTTGAIELGGEMTLDYVGHATTPEWFYVITEEGGFFAQSSYTAVFTSLETANAIAGTSGLVNDAVVTLAPGTDVDAYVAGLEAVFAAELPDIGVELGVTADDDVYTLTYEDIDNDQQFFVILAVLVLGGAAAAALNLTARMVEQSRREIGISMALGVPRIRIALRPMLVGLQIAVLGVVFGLLIGGLIAAGMRTVLETILPYPEWLTPLQLGTFATAAAIGIIIPMLAALIPVWRAVRVAPVDAIRTGHLASRGGGLAPLLSKLRLPGDTLTKMPFRNVLRAPRRGILTALGIAATLAVMVLVVGAINSFLTVVDESAAASEGDVPGRVIVRLDGTYPTDAPPVTTVREAASVGVSDAVLQVGGTLENGTESIDAAIEFVDFEGGLFRPELIAGAEPLNGDGIVLSEKAAGDLGVAVGEQVTLRHPVRTGPISFTFAETEMTVAAIHSNPFRPVTYLAAGDAALMGLDGLANSVSTVAVAGATVADIQEELFEIPEVASVLRADAQAELMQELMDQFIGIFQLMQLVVLALVVVIAFNAASIAIDERRRDSATMFAYGVTRWRVIRMTMVESLIVGVVATIFGIILGLLILQWFITSQAPQSMPDLQLPLVLSWDLVAWSVAVGVVAVALAPLLTAPRKLLKMNIPDTLRVME